MKVLSTSKARIHCGRFPNAVSLIDLLSGDIKQTFLHAKNIVDATLMAWATKAYEHVLHTASPSGGLAQTARTMAQSSRGAAHRPGAAPSTSKNLTRSATRTPATKKTMLTPEWMPDRVENSLFFRTLRLPCASPAQCLPPMRCTAQQEWAMHW